MSTDVSQDQIEAECVQTAPSQASDVLAGEANPSTGQEADLETALNAAMTSQRWLVAVWHVSEGRLYLYREANDFPDADIGPAQRLLQDDLSLRGQASGS